MNAYIHATSRFLPGEPVSNDAMETILGQVRERPCRARRVVLRNNGIHRRHYAIDPATGTATHDNAQLTAEAVRALVSEDFQLDDIDVLACGTSSPDQIMPSHTAMVHGELGNRACETVATAGVCGSAVNALRYAALALAAGEADTAVATGSERASSFMRSGMFAHHRDDAPETIETRPEEAFRSDFLRWMLSDGAGAMLLRARPAQQQLSLRIDWIEQRSFAHRLPACMYAGATQAADGSLRGWRDYPTAEAAADAGAFTVKQDVRLLDDHIVDVTFGDGLAAVRERREVNAEAIDWFLPHYSSAYFRSQLAAAMQELDLAIPEERWFTNLDEVGNVGSAAIYLMLDQLMASGRLQVGQRLLCFVPESSRFSSAFMHLTVVDHAG